ncbi:type-4 ice-structuring protein-like [Paramormyrops kingsleyae]|uniref:Antifreeze protein type IV n=1 Tax=Paramormyrops kingsleyae TaxID=1676925 RepID=A0A3B3S9S6_9TELE|nr:type-4 ice-structuring protein-like [Paramormyrops kingsleyae]XP_023656960.1 type-4 ice-structuring protein-like [Paramormyrops kingsleyae]
MKFPITAIMLLALIHGSESFTVAKRDVSADVDKLTKYVQDLSTIVTSVTRELVEKVKNHELTGKAQTYLEQGKVHLQPLADKLQENLKPLTSSIEKTLKPLTDSVQAQVEPLIESVMEEMWKKVMNRVKALLPDQ